ncbi:MAG: ABC-2 family transporter protein [Nanoarchaeota archaeon]|nr:ABC-2 family transporter protein [Nanoarchaeota archaeon]MCA9495397.1 ABC-2 family transporter protein [Nanoarchaeota archaeon]
MKVKFIILFKVVLEYKINFYMALINNVSSVLVQAIILSILYLQFKTLIGWEFEAYVFFILILNFMFRLTGAFWFSSGLKKELIRGNINDYLTKPTNVFIQYLFNNMPIQAFMVSSIYFTGLILFVVYYFDILSMFRLFLLIPFLLLSGLFTILVFRFLDSLAFFIKENYFLIHGFRSINLIYTSYPVNMFDNVIKKIGYFFGIVYFGAYATEFLFFKIDIYEFYLLHLILLILIFLSCLFLYGSWKFGLRKYEAFG